MSLTSYQAAPPRVLVHEYAAASAERNCKNCSLALVLRSKGISLLVKLKPAPKSHSGKILVGTASWSDPGFVEHWYPKKMPAGARLAWYAQHFEMVEVNSTFYAVPDPRMVERWCQSTPDRFTFDVKLHQLLSR